MPDLLLPPKVVAEIEREKWAEQRAQWRGLLGRLFDFEDPVCLEWNPEFQALDPQLRLGRARPMAYERGYHVIPNYYHWVRDNGDRNAPPTVTPITGPDGTSFAEPASWVLDKLRASDLRNPEIFAMLLEGEQRYEAERKREERLADEERQHEIWERFQAATRVGVSMNDAAPWSQNMKGRRKR